MTNLADFAAELFGLRDANKRLVAENEHLTRAIERAMGALGGDAPEDAYLILEMAFPTEPTSSSQAPPPCTGGR